MHLLETCLALNIIYYLLSQRRHGAKIHIPNVRFLLLLSEFDLINDVFFFISLYVYAIRSIN